MAKVKHIGHLYDSEKEFLNLFNQLTYSRNDWQVWEDLMTVMACSISNTVDRTPDKFKRREEQYERTIKNLGGRDIPAQIFATVIMALEKNPDRDFLGELYMKLKLGSHWHGQFFTPYHIGKFISKVVNVDSVEEQIKDKGYISICDPCVGAGALLIAAANTMKEAGINYHYHAVFIGQDIDRVVAMMAYIQLSLLGCPGYIIVGNSLTNTSTGHVLFPKYKDGQDIWITPLFMHEIWEMRRAVVLTQELSQVSETVEKLTGKVVKFNEKEISAEYKKTSKFKPWQEAGKEVKREIKHFTKDEPYGQTWEQAVTEYLKNYYKEKCDKYEFTVLDTIYKVLKRNEITVFYNADENALFDVSNERIEKEYQLIVSNNMPNSEISADSVLIKEKAKLKKEIEVDNDNTFTKLIITYILKRCEEDEGLCQDIMQEHKTWKKCFDYIYKKARSQSGRNEESFSGNFREK